MVNMGQLHMDFNRVEIYPNYPHLNMGNFYPERVYDIVKNIRQKWVYKIVKKFLFIKSLRPLLEVIL